MLRHDAVSKLLPREEELPLLLWRQGARKCGGIEVNYATTLVKIEHLVAIAWWCRPDIV